MDFLTVRLLQGDVRHAGGIGAPVHVALLSLVARPERRRRIRGWRDERDRRGVDVEITAAVRPRRDVAPGELTPGVEWLAGRSGTAGWPPRRNVEPEARLGRMLGQDEEP